MKKLLTFVSILVIMSLACNFNLPLSGNNEPPAEATTEPEAPRDSGVGEFYVIDDITPKLEELGGMPCEENEELICVTLQVPLNHFDSANAETIDVVFGVLPATGERYGLFIQAFPGGPGGKGISTAYWSYYEGAVLEHYDIVYFDQRGLGLSTPLECPIAYANDFISYLTDVDTEGVEGYDTPAEQQELIDDSKKYAEDCVAEIGIEPEKLAFFGTDQVAEDIEFFRNFVGDEKFWIYGVSYGTAVAQTYAYAHPDRLAGVILDGTIDMTVSGEQGSLNQEKAFDKVLVAVLNACNEDSACSADMNGEDAVQVYDDLAAQVSKNPIAYEFPLANGGTARGTFTFNQLEFTTAYQMYSMPARTMYLKALAAANNGNLVPMLRLMYDNATIDPATYEYLSDPDFSDTMFLSVLCTDDTFFSGTPEERVAQSIEVGQASNGTVPRLDGSAYTGVSCAYWPSSPTETIQREPLVLEGVPVLVLNAVLDPATPFEDGLAVFQNLDNGYHIYTEGGVHSIIGWGYDCPDIYVNDFLIDGTLPSEREVICEDWGAGAIEYYVPNLGDLDDYSDLMEVVRAIDDNIYYLPEYYYGDFEGESSLACDLGGSYTFIRDDNGETYIINSCEMIEGFIMSGDGSYDANTGVFTWEFTVTGDKQGSLIFILNYATDTVTLNGEYGGETIALSQTR